MELLKWITGNIWHFIAVMLLLNVVTSKLATITVALINARVEKKFYCRGCKLKERCDFGRK